MSHLKTVKREADVIIPEAGEKYVGKDGTVSKVLDDFVDRNYEPTPQEIKEFAEFIGMELPQDEEFLYIVRNALKTPLPKEWKPCQTDDNEIYYFNFKTGESRWEHPMDDIARSTFEKEKQRLQDLRAEGKMPPKSAAAASGMKTPAGASALHTSHSILNSTAGSSSNSSLHTTATRTIFTSDGALLHKEPGKATPTASTTTTTTTAKSALAPPPAAASSKTTISGSSPSVTPSPQFGSKTGSVTSGASMKKEMIASTVISSSSIASTATATATATAGSTPRGAGVPPGPANRTSAVISMKDPSKTAPATASATAKNSAVPASSSASLRSEAESQIEERIRQEVAQDIQIKRDVHEKEMNEKLRVLREIYNKKTKEARDSDTESRRIWREEQREKGDRVLQEARQRFQTQYSDDLHELERRAEHLKLELARLEKTGNRQEDVDKIQRDVAEREAAAELSERLSQLALDMETEQKKKQREKEIAFLVRKKEKERESEEMMEKVQEEVRKQQEQKLQKARKDAEDRQKRSELEKRVLEQQVETLKAANARMSGNNSLISGSPNRSTFSSSSLSSASPALSSPNTSAADRPQESQEDLEAAIKKIHERRDEQIEKLRSEAKKEQAVVREGKKLEMDKLHYLISQAKKAKEAAEKSKKAVETAITVAAAARAATQKVNSSTIEEEKEKEKICITELLEQERIKMKKKVEADEQLRLEGLKKERDNKLQAISVRASAPAITPVTQRSPSPTVRDLERVAKECEAELNSKKVLYKELEDTLCDELAKEMEMKDEKDEAKRLEETVAQEMQRYTTDVLSRRDRLQKEYELRLERHAKQLSQLTEEAKSAAVERRAADVAARVAIAVETLKQQKQSEAVLMERAALKDRQLKEKEEEEQQKQQRAALNVALKEEEATAKKRIDKEVAAHHLHTLAPLEEEIRKLRAEKEAMAEENIHPAQNTAASRSPTNGAAASTTRGEGKDDDASSQLQQLEKQVLEKEVLYQRRLQSANHPIATNTTPSTSTAGTTTIVKKFNTPYHTANGDFWIKRADHQSHREEIEGFYVRQQAYLKHDVLPKLEEQIHLATTTSATSGAVTHGRSTTPHTPLGPENSMMGLPVSHSRSMTPPSITAVTAATTSPGGRGRQFDPHNEERSPSATTPGQRLRGGDGALSAVRGGAGFPSPLGGTPSPSRAPSQQSSNDSLHTSDALRFLQVQQKESGRRTDALKEAKREWQHDVQEFFSERQQEIIGSPQRGGGGALSSNLYVDPHHLHSSNSPSHRRYLSNGSGNGSQILPFENDPNRTTDALFMNTNTQQQQPSARAMQRYPGNANADGAKRLYELQDGGSSLFHYPSASGGVVGQQNISYSPSQHRHLPVPSGSLSASLPLYYSPLLPTPNASFLPGTLGAANGSTTVLPPHVDDSIGSALLRLNYRLDVLTHQANSLAKKRMEHHKRRRSSAAEEEMAPPREHRTRRSSREDKRNASSLRGEKEGKYKSKDHQHATKKHRRRSEEKEEARRHSNPPRPYKDHYDSVLHRGEKGAAVAEKSVRRSSHRRSRQRATQSAPSHLVASRERGAGAAVYEYNGTAVEGPQNVSATHPWAARPYNSDYPYFQPPLSNTFAGEKIGKYGDGSHTHHESKKARLKNKWSSRLLDLSNW